MEFAVSQPTEDDGQRARPGSHPPLRRGGEPGWASGLRNLYNSVLNEPLPDSFDDLLKKLDKGHEG